MNLLIVDDEFSTLQMLQEKLQWKKLGFSELRTALSKPEAIKLAEVYDADVLLCDIEMPRGSGLELLEWFNSYKPGVRCVFMTCHAEFSYAQRALQLGSFDYILKPPDFEKLEEILKAAIDSVQTHQKLEQINNSWEDNKKSISKQFWKDIFVGDIYPSMESIKNYLSQHHLDIRIDSSYFLHILISPKRFSEDMGQGDHKLMLYALRNMTEELLSIENIGYEFQAFSGDTTLMMLELPKSHSIQAEILQKQCTKLVSFSKEYLDITVCCYIGTAARVTEIPSQIETLQIMDFNNVILTNSVMELAKYDKYHLPYQDQGKSVFEDCRLLLDRGKYDSLLKLISNTLSSKGIASRTGLERFYINFYILLYDFAEKHFIFLDKLFNDEKSQQLTAAARSSVEDMGRWTDYAVSVLQEFDHKNTEYLRPVDLTRFYIENHLSEDLTLEKVAEQVHLNPDYLNRIFKKEFGMSINKYAIGQKIEHAKWLLRHTDKPLVEIAAQVGYFNYSSFTRMFQKVVGCSPQEWKQRG